MRRIKITDARQDASDQTPSEADVRLGRRIRALRLERKLGITEVAQRAGISVGALSQIERGLTSLRIRVLWPLAAALGVEPHSLLSNDQETAGDLLRRPRSGAERDTRPFGRHAQGTSFAARLGADGPSGAR